MKYRYLSIILLILIFSVGAVCAQDDTSGDVGIVSVGSDDVMSLDDNAVILQDNGLSNDEIHINDDNYNQYFDEDGIINSNVSANSDLYIGNITNKTLNFDKTVNIFAEDSSSVLVESTISFITGGNGSLVEGLTFYNNEVTAISIMDASDITIFDNIISVISNVNNSASAVLADFSKNLNISANAIVFNGKTDGYTPINAMGIVECDDIIIEDNVFEITIPSAPNAWDEDSPGSGHWISNPATEGIYIFTSNGVSFKRNHIFLNSTDVIGEDDSIYVVDIRNCDDAEISENEIDAKGLSYIYGIIIVGDNFNIENNTINVDSNAYYANGIDIEGPASGVVKGNTITASAPTVAYPVYSAMSNGDVEVSYIENYIEALADIVYGMELTGKSEVVMNNTIIVMGNKTTGIAGGSKFIYIADNDINALGENLGNTTIWEVFEPYTAGIGIYNSETVISGNSIYSTALGFVNRGGNITLNNNTIVVNDSGLCNSVAVISYWSDSISIYNNDIQYQGNTNGTNFNLAMYILDSDDVIVSNNEFTIEIPSVPIDWQEIPPGSGNYIPFIYSEGIKMDCVNGLDFSKNQIEVSYNNVMGDMDSIYALHIDECNDAQISDNCINAEGHSYIYGLVINGENFVVDNNTIQAESDAYYACGIDVEGNASGIVENNDITAEAPVVAYPVYSSMSGKDVYASYVNNTIYGYADIVYGMELAGTEEIVTQNNVVVEGNKTSGIVSKSKDIVIADNTVRALGIGLGNTTIWEEFDPYTTGIMVRGSNAVVSGNDIVSYSVGIVAAEGNATLNNNSIIVYDNSFDDSAAIFALDMDDLGIYNNDINYTGNSNGTTLSYAILISDSNNTVVDNNIINAEIPSIPIDWEEVPAGSGNYIPFIYSGGILIETVDDLEFTDNDVYVSYNNVVGDMDSIYAVNIDECNDAQISDNCINAEGHSYIYGLVISGESFVVDNNVIDAKSDEYYACSVNVEGNASGVVENSLITAEAPVVAYPVYSSMSGNEVYASYLNNTIVGSADVVYGMELAGNKEIVEENSILVEGNYTTGIAGRSDILYIRGNKIVANGENLGNPELWESFAPETVGVKIIGGNATVYENNITVTGNSTVNVTDTDASVTYNYLICDISFGDDSVYFTGNATVHDNYPNYDAFLDTEDLVMYYKNGSRFNAKLHKFDGTPLANKTITFIVNGAEYNRTTDENGTASIAINLPSGEYEMITTYNPEGNYSYVVEESNTIDVLTTVFGDDIVKIFRNGTQYYATFLDGQGNPLASGTNVTFNIHGVFYTRQVNGSEGKAKLNINLEPGEYIITAINPVNGEMHANNITVLANVASNDLVKYFRNESQFVVTVFGADGNPVGAGENVTFNINGVFYTRQTNESGQAKLNINLAQGNYTITTMYNGCNVANNIEVLPILYAEDLVMTQGTSDQFRAKLVDGQGNPCPDQNITFNIHGVFYQRTTNADGWAALNIKLSATPNTYTITSMYGGCTISNKIIIKPA